MYLLAIKLWYILFDKLKSNNKDPWRGWCKRYRALGMIGFKRWLKNQNHNDLQNIITELKEEILTQRQPF